MTDREKNKILDTEEDLPLLEEDEFEDLVDLVDDLDDLGIFDDDDSLIEDIVSGDLGVLEDYE